MQAKTEVFSLISAGIAGSNHSEGMDIRPFCWLFVVYVAASETSCYSVCACV